MANLQTVDWAVFLDRRGKESSRFGSLAGLATTATQITGCATSSAWIQRTAPR